MEQRIGPPFKKAPDIPGAKALGPVALSTHWLIYLPRFGSEYDLQFVSRGARGWSYTVFKGKRRPEQTTLAIAASWTSDPYVVHRDPNTGALAYVFHPKDRPPQAIPLAKGTRVLALTVELEGTIHALLQRKETVLYTSNRCGKPSNERLRRAAHGKTRAAIAVDGKGRVHIVWWDRDTRRLEYWVKLRERWKKSLLARGNSEGRHLDLAVDNAGRPHVCFGGHGLVYMTVTDGHWSRRTISENTIAGCAIAVEESGGVFHLCYADKKRSMLMYATNSSRAAKNK